MLAGQQILSFRFPYWEHVVTAVIDLLVREVVLNFDCGSEAGIEVDKLDDSSVNHMAVVGDVVNSNIYVQI